MQDNAMIAHIINLLQCDVHVGIVTAAGYPGEAQKVHLCVCEAL
jgi:IMP and pyridine-specific 5'-nucleotidase